MHALFPWEKTTSSATITAIRKVLFKIIFHKKSVTTKPHEI